MHTWGSTEAAERWHLGAERRAQALGPVTQRMIDAVALEPGMHVLDVAAGTGETSVLAAQRVGARGRVLATDISASMLEVAARTASETGLANVETLVSDASALDLPAHSFDAAISRFGLMFVPDLRQALRAIHAALKPGGRMAALVWSEPEHNPYMAAPIEIVEADFGLPSLTPAIVTAFSLSTSGRLSGALEEAGFQNVQVERLGIERRFESLDQALHMMLTASSAISDLIGGLAEADRQRVMDQVRVRLAQFVGTDGACAIPGEVLLGTASA